MLHISFFSSTRSTPINSSLNKQSYNLIHSFIASKHLHFPNSLILTTMVQNGFYTHTTSVFLPQTSFHWNFNLRFHSLYGSVSISLNLQLDWFPTATGYIPTELTQINIRFLGYWPEHDYTITIKNSIPSKNAILIHCAKSAKWWKNNLGMNLGDWTWSSFQMSGRNRWLLLFCFPILLDFLKCFKGQLFQRTRQLLIIRSQNSKLMSQFSNLNYTMTNNTHFPQIDVISGKSILIKQISTQPNGFFSIWT